MAVPRQRIAHPSPDPFARLLQRRAASVRAPESLRIRIGWMIAAEKARSTWEPQLDGGR